MNPYLYGLGAGASLIVAIGAQNAFVLRQGLMRQYVGQVVLVCAMADACLIVAGVAGMGALVQGTPWLLQVTRAAGALFLLTYAIVAARRAIQGQGQWGSGDAMARGRWRVLLTCLGFTLLNPHVYLDTVVLLGSLSTRFAHSSERAWFTAGAVTASFAWFAGLGFGARWLLPWFTKPSAWQWLDAGVAVLMLVLAALMIVGMVGA
ncbi:LysE/ArgO family amino acid transporter [Dyella sp.]|uniref:LysE/ArgO family amino acid transporter n=1 Tax=Dyella sp. TaxID=1869338 RepID=UPI002ED5369A